MSTRETKRIEIMIQKILKSKNASPPVEMCLNNTIFAGGGGDCIVIMFSWCLHSGLALARLRDFTSIGSLWKRMSTHYNQRRKIPEKKNQIQKMQGECIFHC